MFPINRCRCCKHYVVYPREDMRGCPYCDAFPKGIPFDIFTEKVKQLFSFKEAQERAEKEAREKERQERIKARRNKRGMER